MTEQFKEYVQYGPFLVRTNNNPLAYVMTTLNLDVIGHRWVAALIKFNMTIENLQGTNNKVADALSRVYKWLDKDTINKILECARIAVHLRLRWLTSNLFSKQSQWTRTLSSR